VQIVIALIVTPKDCRCYEFCRQYNKQDSALLLAKIEHQYASAAICA